MSLKKPTITECIDGKGHFWMVVSEEVDAHGIQWEHRWCQKCGGLTQVTIDDQGQAVAAMTDDKNYYLMLPKVLSAVIK